MRKFLIGIILSFILVLLFSSISSAHPDLGVEVGRIDEFGNYFKISIGNSYGNYLSLPHYYRPLPVPRPWPHHYSPPPRYYHPQYSHRQPPRSNRLPTPRYRR